MSQIINATQEEVCLGLRLTVPFWCSFRDPNSSNVHRTFPVPPPSTLYGLIAAAMGEPQDYYLRRDEMRFAVAIEQSGEIVESFSKWMKIAEPSKDQTQKDAREAMRSRGLLTPDEATWAGTTLVRQKLIQPQWTVGVLCTPVLSEEITNALKNSHWPLYLGESDDVVDIQILGVEVPVPVDGAATGSVGGVHEGGQLVNLPARFALGKRDKWEMTRWLVTVPNLGDPITANVEGLVSCHGHNWQFEPPANVGTGRHKLAKSRKEMAFRLDEDYADMG